MKFYILLNEESYKEIIKEENESFYIFLYGPNKWAKTNLFDSSFILSSGKYKIVDEKEAIKLLKENICIYEKLWKKALDLANQKHFNYFDKIGEPYILHPKYVSDKFEVFDFKIVGILHDIIEDTDITLIDLENIGFPKKIIKAIDSISRRKDEKYFEYIERLKKNTIAKKVKIEDLKHNLLSERIDRIENNESMKKRYLKALKILEE